MDCLRWQLAWLVALAIASRRTLVLPPVMFDFGYQLLAIYVDVESISQLVEWRETSFLSDPRFHRHLLLGREGITGQEKPGVKKSRGLSSSDPPSYESPAPFRSVARLSVLPTTRKKLNAVTLAVTESAVGERCRTRSVESASVEDALVAMVADSDPEKDAVKSTTQPSSLERDVDEVVEAARDAEVLFVSLPMVGASQPPLKKTKGVVNDVYKALRFCVKGKERGSDKGFIPGDTTVGHLCVTSKHKDK